LECCPGCAAARAGPAGPAAETGAVRAIGAAAPTEFRPRTSMLRVLVLGRFRSGTTPGSRSGMTPSPRLDYRPERQIDATWVSETPEFPRKSGFPAGQAGRLGCVLAWLPVARRSVRLDSLTYGSAAGVRPGGAVRR